MLLSQGAVPYFLKGLSMEAVKYNFNNYRANKPTKEGWYVWRLPHKFIDGVTLIFLAKFRERGAGHMQVLSPEFDYWDGYRVLLPNGPIEWADYEGDAPRTGNELIEVVGATNKPCPFCKKVPTWGYSGRYITAGPTDTESYHLRCCHWYSGFKNRMHNPLELSMERNKALDGEE